MPKLTKISSLFRKFHTFPVTEGYTIGIIFSVHNPSKKAHSQNEIWSCLDAERHEFWKRHNSSIPWARESPNPTAKDMNFAQKLHSLTPAKMPRKVFIFPEFRTSFWNALINPIHTNQTTTWEHLVACFLNCRPIVTHSDSSTLAQDAVLNCYKKPAHYYYQFSDFSEGQPHLV